MSSSITVIVNWTLVCPAGIVITCGNPAVEKSTPAVGGMGRSGKSECNISLASLNTLRHLLLPCALKSAAMPAGQNGHELVLSTYVRRSACTMSC